MTDLSSGIPRLALAGACFRAVLKIFQAIRKDGTQKSVVDIFKTGRPVV